MVEHLKKCPGCGSFHAIEEFRKVENENSNTVLRCPSCTEEYVYVKDRNLWYPEDVCVYSETADVWFHDDDEGDVWDLCAHYEEPTYTRQLVEVDGELISAHVLRNSWDYFQCDDCDEWHRRSYATMTCGGETICDDCYEESYFTCSECGEVFHYDDAHHDRHDEIYCSDCYYERRRDGITNYSADPTEHIHLPFVTLKGRTRSPQDNVMYLGVELEVEHEDEDGDIEEIAEAITPLVADYALLKEDGSLTNGFEICTVPATLSAHTERLDKFFKAADLSELRSYNTNTCGIHVHMSRNMFSGFHLGKFISFIYNPMNETLIKKIAQRNYTSSTYTSTCSDGQRVTCVTKHKRPKGSLGSGRYHAVNLTNGNTVEVRIFKGTLKQSSVMRCLEFCHASWAFSKEHKPSDMHHGVFLPWINKPENRKAYPNLHADLVRWDFIKAKKNKDVKSSNGESEKMTINSAVARRVERMLETIGLQYAKRSSSVCSELSGYTPTVMPFSEALRAVLFTTVYTVNPHEVNMRHSACSLMPIDAPQGYKWKYINEDTFVSEGDMIWSAMLPQICTVQRLTNSRRSVMLEERLEGNPFIIVGGCDPVFVLRRVLDESDAA